MQNCKVGSRPACAWAVGNGSPRQGTNMVTDPIKNIVTKPARSSRIGAAISARISLGQGHRPDHSAIADLHLEQLRAV